MSEIKIKTLASQNEQDLRKDFMEAYKHCPIPENEILTNVGLFRKRQDLTKTLFFNDLYTQFKDVHGVIMELGVRWGQNLATLINLRGIHEPYNHSRRIIGFDTFSGFAGTAAQDGGHEIIEEGAFNVTGGYKDYLDGILAYHESECPLSHIKKFALVEGDASQTLPAYLQEHPETLVAFAYFDFDIYQPTRDCLELLLPRMAKGGIIGFDELCDPQFPGETAAFLEQLGQSYKLRRSPYSGIQSYVIIE